MTSYKGLSDERLARSVAAGDRPFQALYERYHQPLYRYCHSIVRNEADAHDALQSTFMRALVALRAGRRNAPLRPWLYRIAHNEAISVVRSRSAAERRLEHAQSPTYAPSADERADARARLSELLADLAALPERARGALVMRELGGLSHEEIAAALGMSAHAAKQAIFEARTGLAEIAEGRDMKCVEVRRRLSDGDARVLRGRRMRSHLSDCSGCAAFAAAITTRRTELRALSPVLAPTVAVTLLARVLEHGHAGLGAAGDGIGSGGSATSELGASSGSSGATGSGAASATGVNGVAGSASGVGIAAKALMLVGPKALLALAAALAAGALAIALPHGQTHSGRIHAAGTARTPLGGHRGAAGSSTHHGNAGGNDTPGAAPRHGVRADSNSPGKHAARHGPPPNARANGHGNSGTHGHGPGQRPDKGNRGNNGHSRGVRDHGSSRHRPPAAQSHHSRGSHGSSRSHSSSKHGHERGGPRHSPRSRR